MKLNYMNLPKVEEKNEEKEEKNPVKEKNNDEEEKMIGKKRLPEKMKKKWKTLRKGAGKIWEDPSLEEWPDNDYRIFCGNLGNEVSNQILSNAFLKYPSFQKAKVIRDKNTGKSKGYGFVSLLDVDDYIKAMKEMNGKYVGNRPIQMKRSKWKDRSILYNNSKVEGVKFKKNRNKSKKKKDEEVANTSNNALPNNNLTNLNHPYSS